MGNEQSQPDGRIKLPKIKFRVLIIGRANAGKTSILQRVCDTTDSPVIYRRTGDGKKEKVQFDPSMERGEHTIEDEFVFTNHKGYVFHDSRGFECGSDQELRIVQQFIRRKTSELQLKDRLHAIWYCVPMDNQRPELDLKYFKDICPDKSVPIIAVFTKYDQFLRNVKMHLQDFGKPGDTIKDKILDEAMRQFDKYYHHHLGDDVRFVQLQNMHMPEMHCNALLEETVEALNEDVLALMLLAVQKSKMELSVREAVKRSEHFGLDKNITRYAIERLLYAFPQIWVTFLFAIIFAIPLA